MIKDEKRVAQGPYSVERQQIINEIGDLESIRQSLGLSRRKICKLLLVDPSSWTRWTKNKEADAPAYIYRSLQWCLAIMDKYPESHPLVRSLSYEKENKVDQLYKKLDERMSLNRSISFELKSELDDIKAINKQMAVTNQKLKRLIWGLFCFVLVISSLVLLGSFKLYF